MTNYNFTSLLTLKSFFNFHTCYCMPKNKCWISCKNSIIFLHQLPSFLQCFSLCCIKFLIRSLAINAPQKESAKLMFCLSNFLISYVQWWAQYIKRFSIIHKIIKVLKVDNILKFSLNYIWLDSMKRFIQTYLDSCNNYISLHTNDACKQKEVPIYIHYHV